MARKVTAVFDIGKTNKKFFVFDEELNEIESAYKEFPEIPDEDGFPSEDLKSVVNWINETWRSLKSNSNYEIKALNFSTYGASLVNLAENNKLATPFYNYLKPFPDEIANQFFQDYGSKEQFELETSSPFMGMLNSGLQLYYLKYAKPELYSRIRKSVHFPQYLSGLMTGEFFSEYTSLGCHTGLWNTQNNTYAKWVKGENMEKIMCPLVKANAFRIYVGIKIGVGIHDSSAALIPYLITNTEPFVLISTGTWSICMNPFNQEPLSSDQLNADCQNFLNVEGLSVKASRLLLGRNLERIAKNLSDFFGVDHQRYMSLPVKNNFQSKRLSKTALLFDHSLIQPERFGFINNADPDWNLFNDYEDALYNLFDELTDLQIESLRWAIGDSHIKKIFVDGGFSSSEVFMQLLANKLPNYELYSSDFSLGSSLGAAIIVNDENQAKNSLTKTLKMRLHKSEYHG